MDMSIGGGGGSGGDDVGADDDDARLQSYLRISMGRRNALPPPMDMSMFANLGR
jgi:hypothetical protein